MTPPKAAKDNDGPWLTTDSGEPPAPEDPAVTAVHLHEEHGIAYGSPVPRRFGHAIAGWHRHLHAMGESHEPKDPKDGLKPE